MTPKPYTGILAEPHVVAVPNRPLGPTEAEADAENRAEIEKRFAALFDHYGIDRQSPSAGTQLAYALACAHVPGLQIKVPGEQEPQGRGRPARWGLKEMLQLYSAVKEKEKKGLSASAACIHLVKREPYNDVTDRALYRRYQEAAKDSFIVAVKKVGEDRGIDVDALMVESFCAKIE